MTKRKKATEVMSQTIKIETKCGTMKFIADLDQEDVVRGISIVMAKPGSCAYTQAIGYTAMINRMIDFGLPFTEIAESLDKVNDCGGSGKDGVNCPAAIAKALRMLISTAD